MEKRYVCLTLISGPMKSLDEFARRAAGVPVYYAGDPPSPARAVALSFNALLPVPEHLTARRYSQRSSRGVTDNGRDWEIRNWGCPRGAIQSGVNRCGNQLIYLMTTRVAPPMQFFQSISMLFPKLNFTCQWANSI